MCNSKYISRVPLLSEFFSFTYVWMIFFFLTLLIAVSFFICTKSSILWWNFHEIKSFWTVCCQVIMKCFWLKVWQLQICIKWQHQSIFNLLFSMNFVFHKGAYSVTIFLELLIKYRMKGFCVSVECNQLQLLMRSLLGMKSTD